MDGIILFIAFVALVILLVIDLAWMVYSCTSTVIYEKQKKKMYKSLGNILLSHYHSDDTTMCFQEINLLFKHIIDCNEELKRNYASVDFLLEKYLVELNAKNEKIVNFDLQDMDVMKEYILRLINEFKKNNPMEQIKGANNVLLNNIIQHFERGERDEFNEEINQLAVEIKTLQDTLFEKEKNSKKQDALTKVGLVLSVVFGIMTVVQFFV